MNPTASVAALRRARPRNRLLRGSLFALALLCAYAWLAGDFSVAELFSAQRIGNLERFLRVDVVPRPLRDGAEPGELRGWLAEQWSGRGLEAAGLSLGIAVLAIVLAGAAAGLMAPFAARTLMICDPYVPHTRHNRACHIGWRALCSVTRLFAVLLRAIPEYVWAFVLLAIFGPNAWPAVLALAIHNAGILGRLGAETIENLPPGPMAAMRAAGAERRQIAAAALFPLALPRCLLLFFYRFETCVRESTVLGMLGVVSLGYWINEARARLRYDELLFLVVLGALLVMAADIASQLARKYVREGGHSVTSTAKAPG